LEGGEKKEGNPVKGRKENEAVPPGENVFKNNAPIASLARRGEETAGRRGGKKL